MVSGRRPFYTPVRAFNFVRAFVGLSIPTARRFSLNVANSRSRAFRESIRAQEKVPTNLYEYALGGTRTHAIDLNLVAGTRIACYTTGARGFDSQHDEVFLARKGSKDRISA